MKPSRRFPIAILLILILAAAAWYSTQPNGPFGAASTDLKASGTIEADKVSVTAEVSGRVIEILVREGDPVAANAILARLDSDSAAADYSRARGALSEAQARRDLARNGARPEDKAQADAALAQAAVMREGAKQGWDDAAAILKNPQELNAKIDSARAQMTVAAHQIDAAQALSAQAIAMRDKYRGDGSDLGKTLFAAFDLQVQAAHESLLAATAQKQGAEIMVNDLVAIRERPLDLLAQVHQAEGRYRDAQAAAQIAQAARDLVYAGATRQDLAMAEAAVAQAQAAVDAAQVRRDKLVLRAPAAGRVGQRIIEPGQVMAPGTTAFTLVNDDRMTLTVFFPEDRIGRIHLAAAARVTTDSFPQRIFEGRVTSIASQAEFTPKNVQTIQGRQSQVFAVKIQLDNPERVLKPGMPADAEVSE